MDLRTRRALMEAMWKRYRKAPKKMKTKILDELCAATGYHRQYAIAQLNLMEDTEPPLQKIPRTRKRNYTKDVMAVIENIWEEADYPWSVRFEGHPGAVDAVDPPPSRVIEQVALTAAEERAEYF